MRKMNRLPREEVTTDDGLPVDGLPASNDVEGHRQEAVDSLGPRLPGTGGDDLRRPSGGGEIGDENDVQGHSLDANVGPRLPGTGGDDLRRPSGGGE